MNRITSRSATAGFALVEALVALLLLAIALMGASAAMIESLAGQRSALLQMQAADLAGNLAEALRSVPNAADAAAEIADWQAAAQRQLPQAVASATPFASPPASPAQFPASLDVHLQWRDGRQRTPSQLALSLGIGALPDPGT